MISNYLNPLKLFYLFCLFYSVAALGGPKTPSNKQTPIQEGLDLKPNVLSSKALLEDLIARRFSMELATKVDHQYFTVGAQVQLELEKNPNEDTTSESAELSPEELSDLSMGNLDPDKLFKKYHSQNQMKWVNGLFSQYKIIKMILSVGLDSDLPNDTQSHIEKWLEKRVSEEFGKVGTSVVSLIKKPVEINKPVEKKTSEPIAKPETLWDWLLKFQNLAGQLVFALAILFGIIVWRLLNPTAKNESQTQVSGSSTTENRAGEKGFGTEGSEQLSGALKSVEEKKFIEDIEYLTKKLNQFSPKLGLELEKIIISWCQMGEIGYFRIACFAEAVGSDMGRLPIPIDSLDELSKIFSQMSKLSLESKKEYLQAAYWDILKGLNLGSERLNEPFSYLNTFNVEHINKALLEENPKMKTLVTLFMPQRIRAEYLEKLSLDEKKTLLQSTMAIIQLKNNEISDFEKNFKTKFGSKTQGQMFTLDMTVQRIIEALQPLDEMDLLKNTQGPAIETYKTQIPSLAFISQWNEESLSLLLSEITTDEIVILIRVVPELQASILALCPPLTSTMVQDELQRPDQLSIKEKNQRLSMINIKMRNLFTQNKLSMTNLFNKTSHSDSENRLAS